MGEVAALGVGVQIDLQLADAEKVKLLAERAVGVGEGIGGGRVPLADEGVHGWPWCHVVGVVGADDLGLVEARWRGSASGER